MKTITLKLTNLEITVLGKQLSENICITDCFMRRYTGHNPRYNCEYNKCPKQKALLSLSNKIRKELEK